MNRNILGFCVGIFICASLPLCAQTNVSGKAPKQGKDVLVSSGTSKNDYRIEVEKDGEGRPLKIKFKSPEGKVIKTSAYSTRQERLHIIVSPDAKYLMQTEETAGSTAVDTGVTAKIININATGQKVWEKNFPVDNSLDQDDEGAMPYFLKISEDGEKIVFFRTHEGSSAECCADLIVFDKYGNQISSASNIPSSMDGSPSDYEISHDGKILGAVVYVKGEKKTEKHLFFMDIPSGNMKTFKAEGEIADKEWGAGFTLSTFVDPKLPPPGKVFIGVGETYIGKHDVLRRWHGYLKIDEIPNDLSTLLNKTGK